VRSTGTGEENWSPPTFASFAPFAPSRETLLLPPASICSLFVFGDFGNVRRCRSIASESVQGFSHSGQATIGLSKPPFHDDHFHTDSHPAPRALSARRGRVSCRHLQGPEQMTCDFCRTAQDGPGIMRLERRGIFYGVSILTEEGWTMHACPPDEPAPVDPEATPSEPAPKARSTTARRSRRHRKHNVKGGKWCLGPESNQRHADFQSAALPTELPRLIASTQRGGFIGACGPPVQQGKRVNLAVSRGVL
jgi:hypothetical protein